IRKALENRTNMEDDRVGILEAQLNQAKLIAEEADKKYEEDSMCLGVRLLEIFKRTLFGTCFIECTLQRKILENRSLLDEERMDALENQLKEARFLAEEADKKYDEVIEKIRRIEHDETT
ncbi:unnamed protein product, partial [Timema podura]|nr:unnamed protein product [Timema podura]